MVGVAMGGRCILGVGETGRVGTLLGLALKEEQGALCVGAGCSWYIQLVEYALHSCNIEMVLGRSVFGMGTMNC